MGVSYLTSKTNNLFDLVEKDKVEEYATGHYRYYRLCEIDPHRS